MEIDLVISHIETYKLVNKHFKKILIYIEDVRDYIDDCMKQLNKIVISINVNLIIFKTI